MMKKVLHLHFFIALFGCLYGHAQEVSITTAVDTTEIKIGEEIKLTFQAKVKPTSSVQFTNLPQFGPFEVIESYPTDTLKDTDYLLLTKTYGITQFDSGYYRIPRLPIVVDDQIYFSDTLDITVNSVAVDTLKQKLYDIKPIINSHSRTDWKWLWYLIIIPGIIAVIYLLKIYRAKKNTIKKEEEFESPIVKATTLLERLEQKELWQKGEVKSYYIELTEIVRTYIEDTVEIPAMERTTSELIEALKIAFQNKKINISKETINDLNKVLQNADLVKFAKSKPLDFEITADRKKTEEVITTFDKIIPPKIEVEVLKEEIETEKTKLITRRRLIIGAITMILLVYMGLGAVVYVKGFEGLSALFGQKSTKEILESEWYTSSYGYPSLKIETPEILERKPIDSLASIGLQVFQWGTRDNSVAVVISFSKTPPNVDLNLALEGCFKGLESKGAQDIIINEDNFVLGEELNGKKAFGSMSLPDSSKKLERVKYELMLFENQQTLHQILVIFKDNDTYAEQIKQRIFKSLEVEKVSEK